MASKLDSKPSSSYDIVEIIFFLALFATGASFVNNWISKNHDLLLSYYNTSIFYLINIFAKYVVFAFFLSIALFVLVIIYARKEGKIRQKLMNRVIPVGGDIKMRSDTVVILENPKWKLVEEHINSDDANKWRLAILEADIILSELLETLNLPGESIGEKLKSVEESDFDHIEQAWEAHKIRNAIAHQGSDFLLTQREVKRVIKLYESVFEEFKII